MKTDSNNLPPSPSGDDGRDDDGRFSMGNKFSIGNPFAKKVARLRAALLDAVDEADVKDVIQTLLRLAKAGDVAAAKVVLERLLGASVEWDVLARIEALEEATTQKGIRRRLSA